MKRIFINEDQLNFTDLDYEVIRVKGIIFNAKNEILIAHNNGTYQFPGGHLEKNEDMEESLVREIKEETGIQVSFVVGPFMLISSYVKNYFDTGKNVFSKIYYYRIYSDDLPDFAQTNYDSLEKQSEFRLMYVPVNDLEEFLQESIKDHTIDPMIGREMLLVLDEYQHLFGGM